MRGIVPKEESKCSLQGSWSRPSKDTRHVIDIPRHLDVVTVTSRGDNSRIGSFFDSGKSTYTISGDVIADGRCGEKGCMASTPGPQNESGADSVTLSPLEVALQIYESYF